MSLEELTRSLVSHRQALLAFIHALTRDLETTEEIFQEVAVAIMQQASHGKRIDPFLPWAREVARRRVLEHYRKTTRRFRVVAPTAEMVDAVSETFAEQEDRPETATSRLRVLRECLSALTERVRRILDQRYRERLSIERIAELSGLKPDSVSMALWRSHQTLEKCVQAKLGPGQA